MMCMWLRGRLRCLPRCSRQRWLCQQRRCGACGICWEKVLGTTLGDLGGLSFDTYGGIELGWLESSTGGTTYGNLEGSWIGFCLGLVVGIKLGKNYGNGLGLWDGKVIGTTIEDMD